MEAGKGEEKRGPWGPVASPVGDPCGSDVHCTGFNSPRWGGTQEDRAYLVDTTIVE